MRAPANGEAVKRDLIDAAMTLGFHVHWQDDSRRTDGGFPDVFVAGHGAIFVFECKSRGEAFIPPRPTRKGRLMPGQIDWLNVLGATEMARAYVVRPRSEDCESTAPDIGWWQEISYDEALSLLTAQREEALGIVAEIWTE